MKSRIITISISLFLAVLVFIVLLKGYYRLSKTPQSGEISRPEVSKMENKKESTPFILWPAHPLERIYRDDKPPSDRIGKPIVISCARNEYEGCLFGITANVDLHDVTLTATDLHSSNGIISKENIQVRFVGFIHIRKNTPNTPVNELEKLVPCDIPDPILDVDSMNIPAGETQPCWVLVYVPKGTPPGEYKGRVIVKAKEGNSTIDLIVKVYPIALPDRKHLLITNWFDVERIAKAYNVKLWSEEFWKILEKWIKLMADHGQNVYKISIYTIGAYIDENGSFSFDFSLFDRFVELVLNVGRAERIEISHIAEPKGGWGHEFQFKEFPVVNKTTGKTIMLPGEKVFPYLLSALEKHLDEKGWLNITMIHIGDEPCESNVDSWKRISSLVHQWAPKLKRIDAVETIGLEGYLEVWVPTLHHFDNWYEEYVKAMKEGYEVWFYTCCFPNGLYPNRFLDYPLIKARILHWINYAYGLKGYLHWGLNAWHGDPFGEPYEKLPPGDTHITYPGKKGPLSSLRFEAMRDGIEDYEYLKLLEEEIKKVKEELGDPALKLPFEIRAMELCKRVVPSIVDYIRDPEELMNTRELIVKEIISLRERPLALVLTIPPEYKVVPNGPIVILVKGVCEKGCKVTVNGKAVHVDENGYFSTWTYPDQQNRVVVVISKDSLKKVIVRTFNVRRK